MRPLLLSFVLAGAAAAQGPLPKLGEVFPTMSFTRLGKPGQHSIEEFRGKKLLLIQFASW